MIKFDDLCYSIIKESAGMKKYILFITLSFVLSNPIFAQDSNDLLDRFKQHRNSIYETLNLTESQTEEINKIDAVIYQKLEPELKEIALNISTLDAIAKSDDCTIEKVNAIRKDFKVVEKRISYIKKGYEKEFKQILTSEQKTAYNNAKKEFRTKSKKEIKELKKSIKNN